MFFSLFGALRVRAWLIEPCEAAIVRSYRRATSNEGASSFGVVADGSEHVACIFINVPSGARKRTVERLTLTDDRTRLRYETTVEDPDYLEKPASFTMLWDHRPDLKPAPKSEVCEPAIARRYLEY